MPHSGVYSSIPPTTNVVHSCYVQPAAGVIGTPVNVANSINEVDSWIDQLDVTVTPRTHGHVVPPITPDVTMAWLVQQSLPRAQIPSFDGSPTNWVEFVTKFRDIVHKQQYLNDEQRAAQLLQHLRGDAKRAVKGFANDRRGYVLSLKRLKTLFGQKSKIAQVTLQKVTQGKNVQNDDLDGLVEFYYCVSDSIITLKMLNYESDLRSSDTLRQAVRRLPARFQGKWAERCLHIRRTGEEPHLEHFESWLQDRVMAQRESCLPDRRRGNTPKPPNPKGDGQYSAALHDNNTTHASGCKLCNQRHPFWKCDLYKSMTPKKRFERIWLYASIV